jgi:hypothetical protein
VGAAPRQGGPIGYRTRARPGSTGYVLFDQRSKGADMTVLIVSEVAGGTAEQDQALMTALNLEKDPPAGAKLRLAGPTDGGWRIISLWESEDAWNKFFKERLAPMLEQRGLPRRQPQVWHIESEKSFSGRP